MSSVGSVAASQSILSQAQLLSRVSLRTLELKQQSDQQMTDLVAQTLEATTQTVRAGNGRLDLYG